MRSFFVTTLIAGFVLINSAAFAQDKKGPDELFKEARTEAFDNENYSAAITLAEQALALAPDYIDLKVFLGRIYHWNGQSDRGIRILRSVLESDPEQILARSSLADIYIETEQYEQAVSVLDPGLSFAPSNTAFLFKMGYAKELLQNDREAMSYYRRVTELEPSYPFVDQRISALDSGQLKWTATAEYSYTWLTAGFDPWTLGELRLTRRTKVGAIGGAVRYGERFSRTDNEFEIFAYPVLTDKTYGYLAFAVSGNTFFPGFRIGTALYRSLPNRFEVSLGYNYLSFAVQDVNVLNASLLKFTTKYRFNARLFYAISETNADLTALFYARRYIRTTNNFIELRGGYGSAAVEFNSAADINRLNSYELGIQGQVQLSEYFRLRGDLGYFNEEFRLNTSRERYQALISLDYLF